MGTKSVSSVKWLGRGFDTHLIPMPDGEWVGDILPPHLYACIVLCGMAVNCAWYCLCVECSGEQDTAGVLAAF